MSFYNLLNDSSDDDILETEYINNNDIKVSQNVNDIQIRNTNNKLHIKIYNSNNEKYEIKFECLKKKCYFTFKRKEN